MSAAAHAISQEEAFARIRLLRSPNIGPVSYRAMLARFGDAQRAIEALPGIVTKRGYSYKVTPEKVAEAEIRAVIKAGARYVFHDNAEYPELLGEVASAPPILICRGTLELAARPCVAMVGARNASAASVKLAREWAGALSAAGFTVVSGLARGIDGASHEGALPATIGVIASGIDIAYPPQHTDLQERIANEGLLVAEQPPGTEPRGRHFPSRNRIIAGLSSGTLVIEAAPKSGTLITARLAGEAGREVMAIPGSPIDPRSMGCNQLIRDGAVLVQTPDDVIELLEGFTGAPRSTFRVGENTAPFDYAELSKLEWGEAREAGEDAADAIARLLTKAPVPVDELVRQSGANVADVHMALLDMELAGEIERHEGGAVSLLT